MKEVRGPFDGIREGYLALLKVVGSYRSSCPYIRIQPTTSALPVQGFTLPLTITVKSSLLNYYDHEIHPPSPPHRRTYSAESSQPRHLPTALGRWHRLRLNLQPPPDVQLPRDQRGQPRFRVQCRHEGRQWEVPRESRRDGDG